MLSHSLQSCIDSARTFQKKLLNLFSNRSYASLQLVETLAHASKPTTIVELSQEIPFQRSYSVINWWWFCCMAYWLLYHVRHIAQGSTRPWHKKPDSTKPAGPGEIKRLFTTRIFPVLGSPSHPPTNREKSRGRKLGSRFPKRERKKVVKKHKERRKAAWLTVFLL